jgi:hypothetical protein
MKKEFKDFFGSFFKMNKMSKEDIADVLKDAAKEFASAQSKEAIKREEERDRKWMEKDDKLNEKYLFDFQPKFGSDFDNEMNVMPADGPFFVTPGDAKNDREDNNKPQKIAKKPIEVLDELEKHPNLFTLTNLDDKIEMMKDKIEIIEQHYAKMEMKGLLERLENRKKYPEFKEFYDKFPNTNMESIDNLLSKYKLVMKNSDLFIPEFPQEAVNVIKAYNEKTKELCGKEPKYYVIAEESKFKKAYEKRDPILLVQSPFGFYYQILGAWDEEMLIVSEL